MPSLLRLSSGPAAPLLRTSSFICLHFFPRELGHFFPNPSPFIILVDARARPLRPHVCRRTRSVGSHRADCRYLLIIKSAIWRVTDRLQAKLTDTSVTKLALCLIHRVLVIHVRSTQMRQQAVGVLTTTKVAIAIVDAARSPVPNTGLPGNHQSATVIGHCT